MKLVDKPNICTYRGRSSLLNPLSQYRMYWIDFGQNCRKKIAYIRAEVFYTDCNANIYFILGNLDYYLINPEGW